MGSQRDTQAAIDHASNPYTILMPIAGLSVRSVRASEAMIATTYSTAISQATFRATFSRKTSPTPAAIVRIVIASGHDLAGNAQNLATPISTNVTPTIRAVHTPIWGRAA